MNLNSGFGQGRGQRTALELNNGCYDINKTAMLNFDSVLYKWICKANEKREYLDLPTGLIEDSIGLLRTMFGPEYLENLLVNDTSRLAVFDKESNPLRMWFHSGRIDAHILSVLELSSYLSAFRHDAFLPDKVEKMKRDRFWPIFFELAMATRLKRACQAGQYVVLNSESNISIGDFTIKLSTFDIPCECSRMGNSVQVMEPTILLQRICHHIEDKTKTKNILFPLCIKIRSQSPLGGSTYNSVLRLVRLAIHAARARELPTQRSDEHTTVSIEPLTSSSEGMDKAADWDGRVRLHAVRAKSRAEVSEKYDRGEELEQFEMVRLFVKFAKTSHLSDHYSRLTTKLLKKLQQTRIRESHLGKIVFMNVPFSLRTTDTEKLKGAVRATQSRAALAIVLADREQNPQYRYHYSQSATFDQEALHSGRPEILELVDLLDRAFQSELTMDPITGERYRRNWAEAQARQACADTD
jgi:hypothetical protein